MTAGSNVPAPGPDAVLTRSAEGLVVGATSPEATCAFLGAFGLVETGTREVGPGEATALYGLDRVTTETRLVTPGAERPAVWVVGCDRAGGLPAGFQRTARAFDIYTWSMDEALDHLAFVGIGAGPVGTLSVGPVTMRQCLVPGPDGLAVVLVESTHRRPSLLDDGGPGGPVPLFSQGHSVVWCVERMDAEAALLVAAGLTKGIDLAFTEAEVSTYLDLPRSPVPIRMTMLADAAVDPLRLELLEFPDDPGVTLSPPHLVGGLWALRCTVDDPGVAAATLRGAGWVAGTAAASAHGPFVAVATPGGVRLQLGAS